MLTATFYQTRAERNWTNKLADISPLTGLTDPVPIVLKDGTSILHPHITLALNGNLKDVSVTDLLSVNYVYINDFTRYYFVDDIQIVRTGLFEFTLSYDPLPYFAALSNQYGMVSRYEHGDSQLTDKKRPYYNYATKLTTVEKSERKLGLTNFDNCWIFVTFATDHYPSKVYFPEYADFDTENATPEFSPYNNSTITLAFKTVDVFWEVMGSKIFSDTKLVPYVLGIRVYPFNIENSGLISGFSKVQVQNHPNTDDYYYEIPIGTDGANDITVELGTGITDSQTMYINKSMNSLKGKITIPNSELKLFGNYRDLEPYSKYILHLPWLGDIDINAEVLLAKTYDGQLNDINIEYCVDWTIGDLTYKVSVGSRELFINSCSIGSQIPFTYSNSADVERLNNKYNSQMLVATMSGFLGAMTSTVGAFAMPVKSAGLISQAANGTLGSLGSSLTQIMNLQTEKITNVPQGQVSSSNSNHNNGILSNPYVYVIKYTMQQVELNESAYAHLYGSPYNKTVQLSTLQKDAYVEIVGVHIPLADGVIDAYNNFVTISFPEEAEMLANELAAGVIIK